MKRSSPKPSKPQPTLTQKRICLYMDPTSQPLVPLKQQEFAYVAERGNPLTAELYHAMRNSVQDQLAKFKEESTQPLQCAFNSEHIHTEYVVSHYIRYFDEMCAAFLKMFSSFRLPDEYEPVSGGFLAKDEDFRKAWTTFHQKRANLRILCRSCHLEQIAPQYKVKKQALYLAPSQAPLNINTVLKPKHQQPEHPWLKLETWGPISEKGNYSRKLGDKQITLFHKDGKWRYVYNNKFGEESHETVREAVRESYNLFRETIHRFG